ncbi:hypothetical protein AAC387_Pa11g1836 [Persea americana]
MKWAILRWFPGKNSPPQKQEGEAKAKSIAKAYEARLGKTKLRHLISHGFRNSKDNHDKDGGKKNCFSGGDNDRREVPKVDDPTSPTDDIKPPQSVDPALRHNLSRSGSRRDGTPIMFSYSISRRKPPPVEKTIECTLEELCHGCVKKNMISREVLAESGLMVEEEELLRIKVKPGWKQGTKITFEGKGDARPGMLPSDVIFLIVEKEHSLFKREGNDLVLEERVPLVKALAGCNLSIPLLGGEKKRCLIGEIIYPGYEKIIEGQGMPISSENGKRGDLRVKFKVDFPTQLREDQRSDMFSLLQDVF